MRFLCKSKQIIKYIFRKWIFKYVHRMHFLFLKFVLELTTLTSAKSKKIIKKSDSFKFKKKVVTFSGRITLVAVAPRLLEVFKRYLGAIKNQYWSFKKSKHFGLDVVYFGLNWFRVRELKFEKSRKNRQKSDSRAARARKIFFSKFFETLIICPYCVWVSIFSDIYSLRYSGLKFVIQKWHFLV